MSSTQDAIYIVEDAAILGPEAPVLQDLDLTIADHAVTVLLGPGGGGKSTLLHALSGRRMPGDLRLDGRWRFRGLSRSRWSPGEIFLLPQRRASAAGGTWRDALETSAQVLLLDEPCAQLAGDELLELATRLVEAGRRRTIVVATHKIAFAKAIANAAVLLCGGTIDCAGPADRFFGAPPTPMAERMILQGNCWPTAKLPSHFRWVSPRLAGMARPGLGGDLERDLSAIAGAGIRLVVTLTEEPPPADDLARHGLEVIHFPVPDMGVPAVDATRTLCATVQQRLVAGDSVVAHCHAGLGRTGTFLAALLVHGGRTAGEAIRAVRAGIRNAIQTAEQEAFVSELERAEARPA